ncbi:MAG: cupin domain-containing protein, partial [Rhizobium sp.]|nr:cupin domain-containing protein [Rhizobium sp.]
SDAGGLTKFGAFVETLPPGSFSSHKHWHEREDEFVFVIAGTVTLNEGDRLTEMRPGDAATFKAGVPIGHRLENRSDADVTYLVVGTRSPNDVVHYTDRDLLLTKANFEKTLTDRAGNPVSR